MYAGRKIRDTFRANSGIRDFGEIDRQMVAGQQNLELIRRQVSGPRVFAGVFLSATMGSILVLTLPSTL